MLLYTGAIFLTFQMNSGIFWFDFLGPKICFGSVVAVRIFSSEIMLVLFFLFCFVLGLFCVFFLYVTFLYFLLHLCLFFYLFIFFFLDHTLNWYTTLVCR